MSCYESYFKETCERVAQVVKASYPEGLVADDFWPVMMAAEPDGYKAMLSRQQEINELWLNAGDFEQFRKFVLEWGREQLGLFKRYALHARREAAI